MKKENEEDKIASRFSLFSPSITFHDHDYFFNVYLLHLAYFRGEKEKAYNDEDYKDYDDYDGLNFYPKDMQISLIHWFRLLKVDLDAIQLQLTYTKQNTFQLKMRWRPLSSI